LTPHYIGIIIYDKEILMDLISVVIFLAIVFWLFRKNSGQKSDRNDLTETQIRWRQEQQLRKESDRPTRSVIEKHWQDVADEVGPEQMKIQRQLTEEIAYLSKNIRPFEIFEWILHEISPALYFRYVFTNALVFGTVIVVPWFLFGGLNVMAWAIFVIIYDLWMFHVHRVMEVTEWDPKYREIFNPEDEEY